MNKDESSQPYTADTADAREESSMAGGKTDPGKSGQSSEADLNRLCQDGFQRNQVPC